MNVTTFYEPWVSRDAPLVELWKRAWGNEGWEPRVLSMADAINHPRFNALSAAIYRFPSTNDWHFEALCYFRWCAYAMADGGVVSDYDVLPRVPFPPREFEGFANGHRLINCAFVAGQREHYDAFIERMIHHVPKRAHISDMTIMKDNPDLFSSILPLVQDYREPEWENYPLTHFGNFIMHREKAALIEKVLYPSP